MARDYSQATEALIDRMCRNVERKDFVLNKEMAEECILKTYDLFNLKRPSNVVWFKDIFDEKWGKICDLAWSAGSVRSAGSAGSARPVWSAWSALDYDFDWFIFEFEYCQNPSKDNLSNENDKKYLKYCELLMQAKEYGLGYRVEWEDMLYCVPTPLVLIDSQNRFHSLDKPAIRWKEASEFYFIHGVSFAKDLCQKVVNKELSAIEILKLENIEQRYITLKLYGAEKLLTELKGELIDKSDRNELYVLKDIIPNRTLKMLKYKCPSTDREYVKFVPDKFDKADEAQSWSFSLSLAEYNNLEW